MFILLILLWCSLYTSYIKSIFNYLQIIMDYFLESSDVVLSWSVSNDVVVSALLWSFLWMWVFLIIYFAIVVFMIIAQRKVLEKAKLPGRWILIPFYNIYIMFKLWWRPGLWTRWLFFPPVLLVLTIILQFDIAKRFNKHRAFGLWLWLLPIVFYPLLAFDKKTKYTPIKK